MAPRVRALLLSGVVGAATLGLSGCSPEQEGVSAVTVDESGEVVVLVKSCDAELEEIELSGGPDGERRSEMATVDAELDEDDEGTFGTGVDVDELDPDDLFEVDPAATSQSSAFGTTVFSVAALRDLAPGEVLAGATPRRISEADFLDADCSSTGESDAQESHTRESAVRTVADLAVALGHGSSTACQYVDRDVVGADCTGRLEAFTEVGAATRDALRAFDVGDVGDLVSGPCGYYAEGLPGLESATVIWKDDEWVVTSTGGPAKARIRGRLTTPARLAAYDDC